MGTYSLRRPLSCASVSCCFALHTSPHVTSQVKSDNVCHVLLIPVTFPRLREILSFCLLNFDLNLFPH